MKKTTLFLAAVAAMLVLGLTTPAMAEDKGKEVTITGEAKCAKCALQKGDKCQTVVEAEGKDGKKVMYYLTDTKVGKDFHHQVCSETKKVTVTGKTKKADGKMELAASKIEVAK
jgi:RecG-like helicase